MQVGRISANAVGSLGRNVTFRNVQVPFEYLATGKMDAPFEFVHSDKTSKKATFYFFFKKNLVKKPGNHRFCTRTMYGRYILVNSLIN